MMFNYSLAHWATFFTAAVLLNLSPGPDMVFILGQTAKRGFSSNRKLSRWIDGGLGVLFVWLGIKLATSDRL